MRRASAGLIPRAMFCSISFSMWKRNSSSSSPSISSRLSRARIRLVNAFIMGVSVTFNSGALQDQRHRPGEAFPALGLGGELPAPDGRQFVELRPAVVIGGTPLGGNPPLRLQAVERRVERALVDGDDFERDL